MGSFRSEPQKTKNTIQNKYDNYRYALSSMCGWRLYMEDAHIAIAPFTNKNFGLFAVFDGHGGPQVAVFVQKYFSKELQKNENFKSGNYQKALKENFLKMDQLIQSQSGQKQIQTIQRQQRQKGNGPNYEQPSHAGCTSNVVLITSDFIYCANAGDSRAVASVSKQTLPLSFDHKPQDTKQLDRIHKAGGTVSMGRVNGNLNLSRALGDLEYKCNKQICAQEQMITADPDIKKIQNKNVQFIIMGCDGIWQVKKNQEMVEQIRKKLNTKMQQSKILEELLQDLVAKQKGGQYGMDNMSSILIAFN